MRPEQAPARAAQLPYRDGPPPGREIEYTLNDDHVAHIVLDAIRHAGEA